ncbi:MAG: hypothetical protein J6Q15_00090, partial [Clostridia bacterium]|nr:hypothetical protein [Clostridia bacterium]
MKNKFLFVLALLSVLTITGCKDKDNSTGGTLSAPQQVTVQSDGDRSLIIFDEVKNAEYYNIYINDVCVTVKSNGTGTIQFDASKIITLPQKYTIKVKAGGEDYFDSVFTDEYEYNHTTMLDAPIISIDGTTLNWIKVAYAEFYDVVVTSHNPTIETTHRFKSNKFNFSNILANKGEYMFKVRAVNESGEYNASIYSNQVKYIHTLTLTTPYNLNVNYSQDNGEMLLSFVSSENVDNFTINIDGSNYSLEGTSELSKYLYHPYDLENAYIIKLTSFAKSKGVSTDSSTLINVRVKANTSNAYLNSSNFSESVSCQFASTLVVPRLTLQTTSTTCILEISTSNSNYLSGFAIYLNDKKYKTVNSNIRQIELPLTEVGTAGIRVQSISNNSNCYSSNLSEVKYVDNSIQALGTITATFNDGIVSWTRVDNASTYYVEVLNQIYRYAEFTNGNSLDISSLCDYGHYWIRVTAMADGFKQRESLIEVDYNLKLNTPNNVTVSSVGDGTYLYFDEEVNADGYVLYLKSANDNAYTIRNHLFTSSPINLASYISEANSYNVKIKAVSIVNQGIIDSELSTEQQIQSVKTLSAPTLSISKDISTGKYYLHVEVDESEKEMADSYEIWINYQSIGEFVDFVDADIDITSYFTNAGQYNFMVKTKAIDSPYVKDSNMASLTYNCIKQLDTVTDINVTKLEDESKYILTFKEQTLAAKYLVRIVKGDDEAYNVEFELNHGVTDISSYLVENGVYRIYVQALATEGSFYTDSVTSGNPYRLTKGTTLSIPQNLNVIKNEYENSQINLTWDKVDNSSGYQVYVYYNSLWGENVLKKSI